MSLLAVWMPSEFGVDSFRWRPGSPSFSSPCASAATEAFVFYSFSVPNAAAAGAYGAITIETKRDALHTYLHAIRALHTDH